MKVEQIAAQLYTLREYMQNPTDIAAGLRKVREIGYTAVQISGIGAIADDEMAKILKDEGLVCCATHENGDAILNNPETIAEKLHALDCKYTAYPYPANIKFDSEEDVRTFAARLNAAGKVLHDAGCVLGYHNHQIEFRKLGDKIILDSIYDLTDAKYLVGEIDTYWVQYGGGSPAEWCQKLDQRLPLLHLKDYKITPENQPFFAEVGYGNLEWAKIIPAAEKSGCEWFIVEQDVCPGDPFESLRMSFDYLKENCCNG